MRSRRVGSADLCRSDLGPLLPPTIDIIAIFLEQQIISNETRKSPCSSMNLKVVLDWSRGLLLLVAAAASSSQRHRPTPTRTWSPPPLLKL